jgi:hypothetical protein
MATHPEQLRLQIKDAIDAGLSGAIGGYTEGFSDDDFDIELLDVIAGKGSSHYIAIFQFTGSLMNNHQKYNLLDDFRSEILDEVAASTNRKRIPNITFKVASAL